MPATLLGAAAGHGQLTQHVVFHVGQEFVVVLVLVMVRVDVDDQNVVELALMRLLAGVGQEPRGVQLFDGDAAAAIGDQIHFSSPRIIPSEASNPCGSAAWIASRHSPSKTGVNALLPRNDEPLFTAPSDPATCRARRPQDRRRAEVRSM